MGSIRRVPLWAFAVLLGIAGIAPFALSQCGDGGVASASHAPRDRFEPIAAQPLPTEQRGLVARLEIFSEDGSQIVEVWRGDSNAVAITAELSASAVHRVAPGRYLAAVPPPDGRGYALTLVRSSQMISYVTEDGAADAPEPLRRAITILERRVR